MAMQLQMVVRERHSEFVADLATERSWLGKGIAKGPAGFPWKRRLDSRDQTSGPERPRCLIVCQADLLLTPDFEAVRQQDSSRDETLDRGGFPDGLATSG
jgi:hypothetical protein